MDRVYVYSTLGHERSIEEEVDPLPRAPRADLTESDLGTGQTLEAVTSLLTWTIDNGDVERRIAHRRRRRVVDE